jgi:5-formyltetrahydrofolate cyclo-ligase
MIAHLFGARNRIRRLFLAQRDKMPPAERSIASLEIIHSLISLPIFQEKEIFFIYCPYRSEVDTTRSA